MARWGGSRRDFTTTRKRSLKFVGGVENRRCGRAASELQPDSFREHIDVVHFEELVDQIATFGQRAVSWLESFSFVVLRESR